MSLHDEPLNDELPPIVAPLMPPPSHALQHLDAPPPKVLAHLPDGPVDTTLGTPATKTPSRRSHRRSSQPEPPADESLALPRGGLVALRRSGGLRFSSREWVVMRDGRVHLTEHAPVPHPPQMIHRLDEDQVAALYRLIQQSGMARLATAPRKASPDALAYELVARVGRKVYAIEFVDGAMPPQLAPLVERLLAIGRREAEQ